MATHRETRDRLIHGYAAVELDVVWPIVTGDLPTLVDPIDRALANQN